MPTYQSDIELKCRNFFPTEQRLYEFRFVWVGQKKGAIFTNGMPTLWKTFPAKNHENVVD